MEFVRSGNTKAKFKYDALNRIQAIEYSDGYCVTYTFDGNGNRTSMEDPLGKTEYTYDLMDRITSVKSPQGLIIQYEYNHSGNLSRLVYPSGQEVNYTYDADNRLTSVESPEGKTTYTYAQNGGPLEAEKLPNGVAITYGYDKAGRICSVVNKGPNGAIISSYTYTFDANGNRTKIVEIANGVSKTHTYKYDSLNRLIRCDASDDTFEAYTYDSLGNRLTKTTPSGTTHYRYNEAMQLVEAGAYKFYYDTRGNLIKKESPNQTVEYTFDARNHLVGYHDSKNKVTFTYDGDGNRLSKTVNGWKTEYITNTASPIPNVIEEKRPGYVWSENITYTYGKSRISQSSGSSSQYFLYDSPGRNVVQTVDSHGDVSTNPTYRAFGDLLEAQKSAFLFASEQFDAETGLIYLRNRYYDPDLGRFISKDSDPGSLTSPQSLNAYVYVENNPVNLVDPLGLASTSPEQLEDLFLCCNPDKKQGGQGVKGHMFWHSPKRKWTRGVYPADRDTSGPIKAFLGRAVLTDDSKSLITGITLIKNYPTAPSVVDTIQARGNNLAPHNWTLHKNDVVTYVAGKKLLLSVPLVTGPIGHCLCFTDRGLEEAGYEPMMESIFTTPNDCYKKMQQDPEAFLYQGPESFNRIDLGGICLSKRAEMALTISDIKGAVYNESLGQIILFGKKPIKLPPMKLDDLAVAIKSVYGMHGKPPEAPGVDMRPSLEKPGVANINYRGQTQNTHFGQVLFEGDYLLKSLVTGKALWKDAHGNKPISVRVPGYRPLKDCFKETFINTSDELQKLLAHPLSVRAWIEPEKIALTESEDGQSMVISESKMRVFSEVHLGSTLVALPGSDLFVKHLNDNFSSYATEFPILQEVTRLGQITGIAFWLRDHGVPIDGAYFERYSPKVCPTPTEVPTCGNDLYTAYFTHGCPRTAFWPGCHGGISLGLNSGNYFVLKNVATEKIADDILKARPDEGSTSWDFSSTQAIDGADLTAQAFTTCRTPKAGNFKQVFKDLSLSTLSGDVFNLTRYYDSFNEEDTYFGRGWDILPYRLEFLSPLQNIESAETAVEGHLSVLLKDHGQSCLFSASHITPDGNLVLISKQTRAILVGSVGLYRLIQNDCQVSFNKKGLITCMESSDKSKLKFEYEKGKGLLKKIQADDGSCIAFSYDKSNKVTRAHNSLGQDVKYEYDNKGMLARVIKSAQVAASYTYDQDKRLTTIIGADKSVLFEGEYDIYNRLVAEKVLGVNSSKSYNLMNGTEDTILSDGSAFSRIFDKSQRLIKQMSSSSGTIEYGYESKENIYPSWIKDSLGNVTRYQYDEGGNVVMVKDALGFENRFGYTPEGLLEWHEKPNGHFTHYMYNRAKGTVSQVHYNTTRGDDGGFGGGCFMAYKYDRQGHLIEVQSSQGKPTSYEYDKGRLVKETSPCGYVTTRLWDDKSRLKKVSDSSGFYTEYTYDDFDQVVAAKTPSGISYWTYDICGRVTSITDPLGHVTLYTYDNLGNLSSVKDALGNTTTYCYDKLNRLQEIVYKGGISRKLAYDAMGACTQEIYDKAI